MLYRCFACAHLSALSTVYTPNVIKMTRFYFTALRRTSSDFKASPTHFFLIDTEAWLNVPSWQGSKNRDRARQFNKEACDYMCPVRRNTRGLVHAATAAVLCRANLEQAFHVFARAEPGEYKEGVQ